MLSIKRFVCIILLSFAFSIIYAAGTIEPWKKVQYSSIDFNDSNFSSQIEREKELHPENCIGNIYVYAVTHATNEAVYSGENPYCVAIVFCNPYEEFDLKLKGMSVTIGTEKIDNCLETLLPIEIKAKRAKVKKSDTGEISETKEATCSVLTPYVIDLYDTKTKEIKVSIYVETENEEKNLNLILKRKEQKGLIKWRN